MEADAYDGLSTEEIKVLQSLSKWSGTQIVNEHRNIVRLVGKVRMRLEAYVDRIAPESDWIPPMEWTAAFSTVVNGGSKLISEWYKREKSNAAMGLTDEQLEIELQKAAMALFEQIPLEDAKRSIRRREYVEERGEQRPPKGERFTQDGRKLLGGK